MLDKPKWMRWATYDRKFDQLDALEDRSMAHHGSIAFRVFARYGTECYFFSSKT